MYDEVEVQFNDTGDESLLVPGFMESPWNPERYNTENSQFLIDIAGFRPLSLFANWKC
jgi:hypothetical protein